MSMPSDQQPEVVFAKSGISRSWDPTARTLLDFAEACGLEPAFSCRAGVCSTCRTVILEGDVDYIEEPLDDPGYGAVLLCCSKPAGRVVLDL